MAHMADFFLKEAKNQPKIQILHKLEGQKAVDAYICAELVRGVLSADELKEWEKGLTKKEKEGAVFIIHSRLKIKNKDIYFRIFTGDGEEFTSIVRKIAENKKAKKMIEACLE